jgi:hypothetical protein
MKPAAKPFWAISSFACPLCAFGFAFVVGHSVADENFAMRLVGIAALCFLLLAVAATVAAFIRKERGRWLTPIAVLLHLALFGLGIST